MKVVGSGSPTILTIRAKSSEVRVLRNVLCRRRSEAVAAAVKERRPAVGSADDADLEACHDEMFVIAKLLDELCRPAPVDQPRELVGPTWLLDPVVRDAAAEAVERLSEAVDVFRAATGQMTADGLRAALETASACTSTLIGLDYVQNHGVV